MSEEEIISKVKGFLNTTFHFEGYTENGVYYQKYIDFRKEEPYYSTAIQGLLDLYNKEKEKNKKLIEGKFREVADKNSYIKDNYISKDKIKEKIEWLDKLELLEEVDYSRIKFATDILKKLLKEEQ